tara:strand:- start:719 stop:1435 length:717 start_codon:yes stop_codon:yes gene_type:complete
LTCPHENGSIWQDFGFAPENGAFYPDRAAASGFFGDVRGAGMKLKYDARTWPRGPILDAIAPGLDATDRATLEKRAARWTNEGIILVKGPYAGSGYHRRYPAAEIALLAVAETLHQRRLQIAAVENVIVALRSQLIDKPGDNPIDLAVDGITGQTVDPQDTLMALAPVGNLWRPINPEKSGRAVGKAELAQHPVSMNICLFHILKPLAGILASKGARVVRSRKTYSRKGRDAFGRRGQ